MGGAAGDAGSAQRERARAASRFGVDARDAAQVAGSSEFRGYDELESQGRIVALVQSDGPGSYRLTRDREFLRCPNCMRKLKDPCHSCGRPLDPTWKVCPFCEAEIGVPAPTPRRQRRRERTADQPAAEQPSTT